MSVSSRLLYSFILMSIIPLVVFGIISFYVTNQAIDNKVSDYSRQTLKAVNKLTTSECKKYERIADLVMTNKSIRSGLKQFANLNYIQKNEFISQMNDIMANYMSNQPDIMQIYLFDTEHTPIYNQGWFYFDPEKLSQLVSYSEEGINWLSITEAKMNYVIYTQPILDQNGKNPLGYLSIHINPEAFRTCFSNMNLGDDSSFVILDSCGRVIVSQNENAKTGHTLDQKLFHMCENETKNSIIKNYEIFSKKSMIVHTNVTDQNWTVLLIIPNEYLRAENKSIQVTMIICILLCILCAIFVYRQMWDSIKIPLSQLVRSVGDAVNHKFDQVIVDDSKDELGFLGRTFGQLINTIKNLMEEKESEQKQKRELELKMLQAQINPHFLFNTLNSLRFTAMMSGDETVSNGLAALSTLLSNTIIDKHQFITVTEELKNIESYVEIQKIRYGDIFTVKYEVEESIKSSYMIKFLLQPIVENSILHGLDESVTTNEIIISMKRTTQEPDRIIVTISDNGKGFDTSTLNENTENKTFFGFALRNVKERIALCFGEELPFEIHSEVGKGTRVQCEFPYMNENVD